MKWIRNLLGKGNHCADCDAPMQLAILNSCQGRSNNVSICFEGLPYLECQNKAHSKREPRSNFADYLIEEIYINDQIPWAEIGTFDRLKCLACKNKLEAADYKADEIIGNIRIEGVPQFKARIHATVGKCFSCGTRQLVSEETTLEDVNVAINKALRDAGFKSA